MGPRASLDILEKRKIFVPARIQTPDHLAHSVGTVPTTLLWFQKKASTSSHCIYFLLLIHWVFIVSQHELCHPVINL